MIEFNVIAECNDENNKPTMWGAEVNSCDFGKYLWIEKESDRKYNSLYKDDDGNYIKHKTFKSLKSAKEFYNRVL